jgi:hypothetical protein
METNLYEYNTTAQWRPQQDQLYEGKYVTVRTGQLQPPVPQNQRPQPGSGNQKPKPPEKMAKARALGLAQMLKKWLAVASLVIFGTFGSLVAFHQVSTTANQTSSGSSQNTTSSNSSSQNSNSFLKQQGGNTSGTSSSTSTSSSTPVSGTHTS